MERKLKILKAVLLRRRLDRSQTKEEQIAQAEANYTDQYLDEEIEYLRFGEIGPGPDDYDDYDDYYERERQDLSRIGIDFSPTHPWDAPGMSIRDFI